MNHFLIFRIVTLNYVSFQIVKHLLVSQYFIFQGKEMQMNAISFKQGRHGQGLACHPISEKNRFPGFEMDACFIKCNAEVL